LFGEGLSNSKRPRLFDRSSVKVAFLRVAARTAKILSPQERKPYIEEKIRKGEVRQ
jgi:hypothetical protein